MVMMKIVMMAMAMMRGTVDESSVSEDWESTAVLVDSIDSI